MGTKITAVLLVININTYTYCTCTYSTSYNTVLVQNANAELQNGDATDSDDARLTTKARKLIDTKLI